MFIRHCCWLFWFMLGCAAACGGIAVLTHDVPFYLLVALCVMLAGLELLDHRREEA